MPEIVSTVIPYKNKAALTGYYCGIFSIIPCLGMLLGPAAVVLGGLGLRNSIQDPESKGKLHAVIALVIGAITSLAHLIVVSWML